MEPYRPLACALYDRLEALATRRARVPVVFTGPDGRAQHAQAVVADVFSEGEAEFLRLDTGAVVRLDALVSVDGVAFSGAC